MFRLGSRGLPVSTILGFFGICVVITGAEKFFMSERLMKRIPLRIRTAVFLLFVLMVVAGAICLFRWFPLTMWEPWVMFFFSYGASVLISLRVFKMKTRVENKQLEQGLEKMRRKWEQEAAEEKREPEKGIN